MSPYSQSDFLPACSKEKSAGEARECAQCHLGIRREEVTQKGRGSSMSFLLHFCIYRCVEGGKGKRERKGLCL